ncbi:MAG: TadE/TadG family type IV pilus assembly protein, partial [Mesorhizobium sp.]
MTKFFPAAVRAACRLWRDESGQFAILTAIGLVVVFGALALAVDYAEMSRHRKEMQSALDAAALATGREM